GLYDLLVGDPAVRPGPREGRAACEAATSERHAVGLVGAGTGCTTGTWRGVEHGCDGGLVAASTRIGEVVIAALVAVNAAGTVGLDPTTSEGAAAVGEADAHTNQPFGNTTIGVVATNARIDKSGCLLLAQSAHDGLARSVFPSHGRSDGDAFVAAATGEVDADLDLLRAATIAVVARAIGGLGVSASS
ncbi:MAG TPA: P1 family peptidase, partial [Protaetiibacter sp.]|nr:P1 family peptidase [Protaetiibacter sp.]